MCLPQFPTIVFQRNTPKCHKISMESEVAAPSGIRKPDTKKVGIVPTSEYIPHPLCLLCEM